MTGRVKARLPGVGSLASLGYDALWSAGYSRAGPALWRTDPATGSARAFPLPCLKQFGLAAGAGGVWVSGVCSAGGAMPGRPPYFSLVRADPATGQVTARYPVTPSPLRIVAGNGAVWASGDGRVIRIDPRTGRATASIAVPARPPPRAFPGAGAGLLALTPGSLWATAAAPAGYRVPPTCAFGGVVPGNDPGRLRTRTGADAWPAAAADAQPRRCPAQNSLFGYAGGNQQPDRGCHAERRRCARRPPMHGEYGERGAVGCRLRQEIRIAPRTPMVARAETVLATLVLAFPSPNSSR